MVSCSILSNNVYNNTSNNYGAATQYMIGYMYFQSLKGSIEDICWSLIVKQ